METYTVTLMLDGPVLIDPDVLTALRDQGLEEGVVGVSRDGQFAYFECQAPTYEAAVDETVRAVERALPECRVVHIG
jgi:hypothetical protein